MKKFSEDALEPQERAEFSRLQTEIDRLKKERRLHLKALRLALKSLEWNVQWLNGEDEKFVRKDIDAVTAALAGKEEE